MNENKLESSEQISNIVSELKKQVNLETKTDCTTYFEAIEEFYHKVSDLKPQIDSI